MKPTKKNADTVIAACAREFNVSVDEIHSRDRTMQVANARMAAIYICNEIMFWPEQRVLADLFDRCRPNISYCLIKLKHRMEVDGRLLMAVASISHRLRMKDEDRPHHWKRKVIIEVVCGSAMIRSKPQDLQVEIIK